MLTSKFEMLNKLLMAMKQKRKSIIENDIILIYIEDRPAIFARVEKIYPDVKPGWWRVKLLILQVPVVTTIWILDNDQIRGAEFTMNGTPIRIEVVKAPETKTQQPGTEAANHNPRTNNQQARILTLNPNNQKK